MSDHSQNDVEHAFLAGNMFSPAPLNNYRIGADTTNGFVAGNIGDPSDWFLMGTPPPADWPRPLLSGRILNSDGDVILAIIRNRIVLNPYSARTAPLKNSAGGYEIHDPEGKRLLAVRTTFDQETGWLYHIEGEFYGKDGKVQLHCSPDGIRLFAGKLGMGIGADGSPTGINRGYDANDRTVIQAAMMTGGEICLLLTGKHKGRTINIDGHVLMNCEIEDCDLQTEGAFVVGQNVQITNNCRWQLGPRASNIARILGVTPGSRNQPPLPAPKTGGTA